MNLLQRQGNDLLTRHVDLLRQTVRSVRKRHPFLIHGWVVLPDHLHCVIELPPEDADFATRWRLIKMAKRIKGARHELIFDFLYDGSCSVAPGDKIEPGPFDHA